MRGYVRDTAYHSQGGNISKELNLSLSYRNNYVLDLRTVGKGIIELGGIFRITYPTSHLKLFSSSSSTSLKIRY